MNNILVVVERVNGWRKKKNKKNLQIVPYKQSKAKNDVQLPDFNWSQFTGYKSNFEDVQRMIVAIKGSLKAKHMSLLYGTAFGKFFKMIFEDKLNKQMAHKCSRSIMTVIVKYVEEKKAFQLKNKGKFIELRPEDVSLIFGMPMRGGIIDLSEKTKRKQTQFETKFFPNKSKKITKGVIKKEIEKNLKKKIKKEEDYINLVKLLLLYSFSAFFFAQTGSTIPKSLLQKFDSLENINEISWPKMIHQFLMGSVHRHSKKPTSVTGCVYILLYFIMEHTGITSPIQGNESLTPRALRWNLSNITKKNWLQKYKSIEENKIKQEFSRLSRDEKLLLEMDSEDEEEDDTELEEKDDEAELEKQDEPELEEKDDAEREEEDDEAEFEEEDEPQFEEEDEPEFEEEDDAEMEEEDEPELEDEDEPEDEEEDEPEDDEEDGPEDDEEDEQEDDEEENEQEDNEESDQEKTEMKDYNGDCSNYNYGEQEEQVKYLESLEQTEEIRRLNERREQLEETNKEQQNRIEDQLVMLNHLKERIEELEQTSKEKQNSFEEQIESLNKENSMHKQQKLEKDAELEMKNNELIDALSIIQALKAEKNVLEEQNKKMNHELTKQTLLELEIKEQNKDLEIKEARNQIATLDIQKVLLDEEVKRLEDENDEMKLKNEEYEKQISNLTEMISKMKGECRIELKRPEPVMALPLTQLEIEEKIKEFKSTNSKKRETSVPREEDARKPKRVKRTYTKRASLVVRTRRNIIDEQTATVVVDQCTKEGQTKLVDPRKSDLWSYFTEFAKKSLLNLFNKGFQGSELWHTSDDEGLLEIRLQGELIQDLYMEKYVDAQVIDWFLVSFLKDECVSSIQNSSQRNNFFAIKSDCFTLVQMNKKDEADKQIDYSINKYLNAETEYIFVPIFIGENHWTLLYLEMDYLKWHHYNSLQSPKNSQTSKKEMESVRAMKRYMEQKLADALKKIRKENVNFRREIVTDKGPQQPNGFDCGIYICKYALEVINGQFEEWGHEDIRKLRADFVTKILTHKTHGWKPENDPAYLSTFQLQN